MAKTPNISLNIWAATASLTRFLDFRRELAGEESDTNMVIIDTEIGKINNRVIFSPSQPSPAVQVEGDIWNEELSQ